MFNQKVFIRKFWSIDTHTRCTIPFKKIPSLRHEAWNDTVEDAVLEPQWFFVGGHRLLACHKTSEVLTSLWADICTQCHLFFRQANRLEIIFDLKGYFSIFARILGYLPIRPAGRSFIAISKNTTGFVRAMPKFFIRPDRAWDLCCRVSYSPHREKLPIFWLIFDT